MRFFYRSCAAISAAVGIKMRVDVHLGGDIGVSRETFRQ
jgi:hypothetical protein